MGRHSAGDDDEGTDVRVAVPLGEGAGRSGRHSRGEDTEETGPVDPNAVRTAGPRGATQDDQPTERIGLADLLAAAEEDAAPPPAPAEPAPEPTTTVEPGLEPEQPAASTSAPAGKRPARGPQSSAADLELLRRHPDVRARVIAAVVVPFVLYAAVLLLIGANGVQYLIFIWIPMVSAGVLAGLLLDAAHRRRAGDADASGPPS